MSEPGLALGGTYPAVVVTAAGVACPLHFLHLMIAVRSVRVVGDTWRRQAKSKEAANALIDLTAPSARLAECIQTNMHAQVTHRRTLP